MCKSRPFVSFQHPGDDRIVRASAALSCGMLRIEAAGEKLAYLWRNDPISNVRDSALSAMRAVGGKVCT